mgnify:CR=1 FL=1
MKFRLLLMLAGALALGPLGAARARKVVVKMATLAPKGSVFHRVLTEMANDWKEASGGRVELRLFAGGVAGDDVDVVRKARLGTLDGGLLTSAGVSTIDKAIHCLQVPMAYASLREVDYVLDKMRPVLEKRYDDAGFIILSWVDAGWVRFFSKKPIVTPEDLAAEKLFVWAGQDEVLDIWKGAGFNPVPLPSTEISTALQTGLVTAVPTTPQATLLMQWNKNAPYMTDAPWAPLMGATVITKKTWEEIDPELRPKLMEIARKAGEKLRAEARPADQRSIDAMAERGLTIVKVDEATRARWRERLDGAMSKVRGVWVPADLFDEAMRHRDAFRKLGAFTDGADE